MSLLAKCIEHDIVVCSKCFPLPQWAEPKDVEFLESSNGKLREELAAVNKGAKTNAEVNKLAVAEIAFWKSKAENLAKAISECDCQCPLIQEALSAFRGQEKK